MRKLASGVAAAVLFSACAGGQSTGQSAPTTALTTSRPAPQQTAAPVATAAPTRPPASTPIPTATPARALRIAWTRDSGARVADGSVPYVHRAADGRYWLYYCAAGNILSAVSADGLSFQKEAGVLLAKGAAGGFEEEVCDPTLVTLGDGKIRMYYKGAKGRGGPGQAIHKIYSAISSDGLTFTREGLRIDSELTNDNGWASVPDALRLPDGRVRLYYVTAAADARNGIASAISQDGLAFTKEAGLRVPAVDPAAILLHDGTTLMFVANLNAADPAVPAGIYSYTSKDGLTFGDRQLAVTGTGIFDPTVLRIDDRTFRVYFGNAVPGSPPQILSATGTVQ